MNATGWWKMLESCPVAEEADWLRHATGFVTAFVTASKKDRWLDLLTRRPRRVGRNSYKLHSDLDRRTCRCIGDAAPAGLRGDGVFYAFFDVPRVVPADLAAAAAVGDDAILSLVPGESALYFFHEGEVWLCRAGRS